MPLRSPKMNRFIFGFQRRVWCPKWTPASSSCFMVTTAVMRRLPSVGRVRGCAEGSATVGDPDERGTDVDPAVAGPAATVVGPPLAPPNAIGALSRRAAPARPGGGGSPDPGRWPGRGRCRRRARRSGRCGRWFRGCAPGEHLAGPHPDRGQVRVGGAQAVGVGHGHVGVRADATREAHHAGRRRPHGAAGRGGVGEAAVAGPPPVRRGAEAVAHRGVDRGQVADRRRRRGGRGEAGGRRPPGRQGRRGRRRGWGRGRCTRREPAARPAPRPGPRPCRDGFGRAG